MTQSAAAVEVRLSCRVGTTGLATVRHHPQHPELIRVAVGASVRFTIAEADAAAVRDAIERARYWGHGSTPLTSEQGLYLTERPRRWYESEERFRLSIGSPLRRWLWRSELAALSAVLACVAQSARTP